MLITAWHVSVFAVFLVRIFPHSDWIRRDTSYLSVFSPNAGKYGPEITPYLDTFHTVQYCVKRFRIRSYSGPHSSQIFPHLDWIRRDTEYLSVFSPNAGKYGPEKLRILTRFTYWMGVWSWLKEIQIYLLVVVDSAVD